MKAYALDICPTKTCGLSNQLYSIVAGMQHCMRNNIHVMFINKFLRSINSNNYSNISDIIDLNKFNNFASKYNVFIVDYNNFKFTIEEAILSSRESGMPIFSSNDIKDEILTKYYKNNNLNIPINSKFYLNDINSKPTSLTIKYNLNNGFFYEQYKMNDNKLMQDINLSFQNLNFEGNFSYVQGEIFFDILRNIPFNENIINNSNIIANNLIPKNSTNVFNAIHLRIEDDVIAHFYAKCNLSKSLLKTIVETKYINIIKQYFNKNDTIILLTYDMNNDVINYLKTNNYKFIINCQKDKDREISAINDMLLGEYCNNYYVCVWESSFSFALLSRINKKLNVKSIQIRYEDLYAEPESITLLF